MASVSGVLYIGVTNNLVRRVEEHKDKIFDGFTKKYNCNKLVYYEYFGHINDALYRETEIKKWRREKKIFLIEKINNRWRDLYDEITDRDSSSAANPRSEWQVYAHIQIRPQKPNSARQQSLCFKNPRGFSQSCSKRQYGSHPPLHRVYLPLPNDRPTGLRGNWYYVCTR